MKLRFLAVLICFISLFFCGCGLYQVPQDEVAEVLYLAKISELEKTVDKLYKSFTESEKENAKILEELSVTVKLLGETNDKTTEKEEQAIPDNGFVYELDGDIAILTGYTGKDETLVIPSQIDGHSISTIGENSFERSKLKSLIISEGVESIGWFAFYNSPFLSSVTIPPSVKKIGYSAFEGCSSSLTIYCQRNSYAHSYAKSYGITYVLS